MKILFLSCMTLLFTTQACKLQQPQGEDKSLTKVGRFGLKASDSFADFTRHIDGLLKSGKKTDYDQLIDMLKKGNPNSDKATRAFHQLVEKPIAELDAAIKKLETARLEYEKGDHKGFFLPEAVKAARDDVDAKIGALKKATKRHNKAIAAMEEYQLNRLLPPDEQLGEVRVLLNYPVLSRWQGALLEHESKKLSKIPLAVAGAPKEPDFTFVDTFIVAGYISIAGIAIVGLAFDKKIADYNNDQDKAAVKTKAEAEAEDKLEAEAEDKLEAEN